MVTLPKLNLYTFLPNKNLQKGCEELDSSLDMIAGDNYVIKQKLRLITEKSRTCIIRDLGMLQKNYPGIATSVKTRSKSFDS